MIAARVTPARLLSLHTACAVAVTAVMLGALLIGPVSVDPVAAWHAAPDDPARVIVFGARLPRILLAASVGGALGLAGAALQALLSNPLACPHVLGISGGIGDFKTLRKGTLRGAPRLARHLWRMCMAMFIATASFFSIRARVAAIFPAPLTAPLARALPVVLVLVVMFYWLWRIRSRVIPARA